MSGSSSPDDIVPAEASAVAAQLDQLPDKLNAIPGVVAHGLFVGLASQAVIAKLPADNPTVQGLEFRRTSTLTT